MKRADLSDYLIHWTRPSDDKTAFDVLIKIIGDKKIIAGNGMNKGKYQCVCFTEAPLQVFHKLNGSNARYHPFGICVPKVEIFQLGGRPVIYQRHDEFDFLHESQRWRHVTYDPSAGIDFTWEREWRLNEPEFDLDETSIEIIIPNDDYHLQLVEEHQYREELRIWGESVGYGDFAGHQNPKDFPYRIYLLQNT